MSSDARLGHTVDLDPLAEVSPERFEVFRHPRRLRLLEILEDDRRRSLADLTTAILEREGAAIDDGRRRHDVRCDIVHNHLPRLEAHDIVDWDTETGVELVDGQPICPNALTAVLESEHDLENRLEQVIEPVRLRVIELVADHETPVALETLSSALATRESTLPTDADSVQIRLHHTHLPALEDAGLLSYDRDTGQVTGIAPTHST